MLHQLEERMKKGFTFVFLGILILFSCMQKNAGGSPTEKKQKEDKFPDFKIYSDKEKELNAMLLTAVHAEDTEAVKEALGQGADIDAYDDIADADGMRPLMYAVLFSNYELATLLLAEGADVEQRDVSCMTALHWAAEQGNLEMFKLLLEHGANINVTDFHGQTVLIWAAYSGDIDTAAYILEQGLDINGQDNNGWTPVMRAAVHGNLEVLQLLIDHGADINIVNNFNMTALDITIEFEEPEAEGILQVFRAKKASEL
jgi:ankyrin repeat protein